jgi:hypothetical protein
VAVDVSELPQVVERLTGLGQLGPYECEQVYQPVASASKGIWRMHGNGWSVVIKLVGHGEGQHPNWQAGAQPEHCYCWRREVLAYETGLLTSLPGKVRAPSGRGARRRRGSRCGSKTSAP